MSFNWYAVYTRPKWERKVAELLVRRSIENYCPLNKVVKQWSDRKKTVDEPLFRSYVFVKVEDKQVFRLKDIDGIINIVHWLGKPAVIKEVAIETIKRFLSEYKNVRLDRISVKVNDLVSIASGPLMDHQGQVVAVQNKTVKLMLPSMGYMMSAEVELDNVQVIKRMDPHATASEYGYAYTQ